MWTIILLAVLAVILFGGAAFYFNRFKSLAIETKDVLTAVLYALKDGKLSNEEKEQIIAKAMEMSPVAKEVKDKFVSDAKSLGGTITDRVKTFINERKG